MNLEERRALARRIRNMRDDRGWSLQELALRSGLHLSTVRETERGSTHPQPLTLCKIAKAFGIEDVRELSGFQSSDPASVPDGRTEFYKAVYDLKQILARSGSEELYALAARELLQLAGRLTS